MKRLNNRLMHKMDKPVTMSVKLPSELYSELVIRVPKRERSSFIREAIIEKLQRTPRPDKILEFEQRIKRVEEDLSRIKRYLADLEILTYEKGAVNPHTFCIDDIDHKIINYLLHNKGATTPELAEATETNRWLILNRLKRIQRLSKQQLGKEIIKYHARERLGKRKAWWINEELVETE